MQFRLEYGLNFLPLDKVCFAHVLKWPQIKLMRPPLNKKLCPVHRPSGLKRADWIFFSHIFQNVFFLLPLLYNLVYKNEIRKKKKIPTSRLAVFLPTRPTGNNFLFKDGLLLPLIPHFYTLSCPGSHLIQTWESKDPQLPPDIYL